MVLNARRRQEERRSLPHATKKRNQQVLQHLGLAYCVARRQQRRGPEEHDDLLQEACLGFIQGMENLNPTRGFRPSTYLMSRANGQVLHFRRDRSRMLRIPWRLQDLYVSGQRLQHARIQAGLPPLNDQSIAVCLKVSPQRWLDACAADVSKKLIAIEAQDLLAPSGPKPDPHADWLQTVLPQLDEHHQLLLRQHWIEGVGLRDLAQSHRLSQRRLKQLLEDAINALRLLATQDGLRVPPRRSLRPPQEAFAAR